MARLIQKSGYIQGGRAARYMEYVAKRDGVEIIQSTEPVTKKQMQFLTKLLKDFPDAKELFEYSDYLQTPNRGTASAFIAAALDTHLHELESESGYMAYIANRPRAEKRGGHGLFSAADVTDLKAAKSELETHAGKVWTFIFSLRREDAERLGYSKAAAWQNLLKQESHSIAEAMRIPPEKFRWYAAYKAIWLALYIVPVIALALCMLQKRKTLAKRCRRRKSGYVVCIPDFVAVLGTVFAAAASLLGVYAVLTASGQLSEMLVIYLICGGGQWLGIYAAALTIRWRIVVKGSELTVYPLFSKIYQINLCDVLSAKCQVKDNQTRSERIVLRTSERRIVIDKSMIAYNLFKAHLERELPKDIREGF